MSPESQDPLIGMTLGGCRIQALLGRGGMGTVYRAHHIALDKTVALKVLAGHLESDAEFVERFQREARAAAKVEHPNVIQVLNVAEEKSQHFIILQFIDGENLEQLLDRSGKLDLKTATRITRDAAAGLEALHAQGIVHRDIKPANIMLTKDGAVKITDFGLARNLKAASNFTTVSGAFMGTPGFIAPEQVDGPGVDARADLYSLGVVYYMALSNELPFNALTALEMATQRVTMDPIPLEDRVPDVDARASAIVKRLLQRDVAARFQNAGDLKAALEQIVAPLPAAPAPSGPLRPRVIARPPAPPPPPPSPAARPEPEEIPEVEIHGRRRPPPAPAPVVPDDSVPEISAGPKKRIIQGEPVVPRQIEASVPLPSKPQKSKPLRAEDYPSNPNLKKEEKPVTTIRPADLKPPAQFKHQPPPKKDLNLAGNLGFWSLVLAACAALFSVGALGSSLKADSFLLSLPQPFIHSEGLMIRLGLAAAAAGLLVAAFLVNRKQIRATSHPGPAVMIPIFAALCFYAAGLLATAEGQGMDRVLSAAVSAWHSLIHPSNLAILAVWSLMAGLCFGISGGEDLDHGVGSVFIMLSLGAAMGFASAGDIPGVVSRCMNTPKLLIYPAGGILVAFLGLFLAFASRAGMLRRIGGILVILIALGLGFAGGLPVLSAKEMAAPFGGLPSALAQHGLAAVIGAMLLTWGGWVLHRMVSTPFSKRR